MAEVTGGEVLARCLAQEGIRFVFGLPCPEIDPLLAALEANGIRLVPIRHEAAAAYMAIGLYKTTGQVAAVLGNPDREVVCVSGDGAAGFHFMELQSAAREGLRLTAIVFAEGSWTMEIPNEQIRYGRTFGTEMGEVRWDRVGEGLGCAGFYVETIEELAPALEAARCSERPAVICLKTSRKANLALPSATLQRFVLVYQGPLGR